MSSPSLTYPFVPKSTAHVGPGQFWSIPRDGDGFGIGVVLGVPTAETSPHHPTSKRLLVVGLLNKVVDRLATARDVDASRLLDWGFVHVKCVEETSGGFGLSGRADLTLNEVLMVSHRKGGTVGLYSNGRLVRAATPDEAAHLPVFGTWGLTFIQRLATSLK